MSKDSRPIWFPQWNDVLQQLRLPPLHRQQYRQALIRYLRFCREHRQQATVESARAFMTEVEAQRTLGRTLLARWKEAINWFFTEGRKQEPVGTENQWFGIAGLLAIPSDGGIVSQPT